MNEILSITVVFGGGLILGGFFYGGLWWTLQKATVKSRPFFLLFASSWLRISASLAGLYVLAGGDWVKLTICLLGFLSARIIITWVIKKLEEKS
jgi:F1F0 ATPase subunit 2